MNGSPHNATGCRQVLDISRRIALNSQHIGAGQGVVGEPDRSVQLVADRPPQRGSALCGGLRNPRRHLAGIAQWLTGREKQAGGDDDPSCNAAIHGNSTILFVRQGDFTITPSAADSDAPLPLSAGRISGGVGQLRVSR